MSTTPVTIPKIRFTLNLDVPVPTALDFHTFWTQYLQSGPLGALAADCHPGDAAITLSALPSALPSNAGLNTDGLIGQCLFTDGEVMLITGAQDKVLTVVRAPNPPLDFLLAMPKQTHAAGQTVYGLKYPSPHHMLVFEGLWPFTKRVNETLGLNSQTYNIGISGSISVLPPASS